MARWADGAPRLHRSHLVSSCVLRRSWRALCGIRVPARQFATPRSGTFVQRRAAGALPARGLAGPFSADEAKNATHSKHEYGPSSVHRHRHRRRARHAPGVPGGGGHLQSGDVGGRHRHRASRTDWLRDRVEPLPGGGRRRRRRALTTTLGTALP